MLQPVLSVLCAFRCLALTALRSLGLCIVSVLFCERLFPSQVAFCTELRVYGFLQGENNWQPAGDGDDMTKSNDQVRRPQKTGFGAGEVEKGGDAAETVLVVTLYNLGRHFGTCCERTNFVTVECCEESLCGSCVLARISLRTRAAGQHALCS